MLFLVWALCEFWSSYLCSLLFSLSIFRYRFAACIMSVVEDVEADVCEICCIGRRMAASSRRPSRPSGRAPSRKSTLDGSLSVLKSSPTYVHHFIQPAMFPHPTDTPSQKME